MDNNFYVYELIDPRTNQPFYIGKGTGNRVDTYLSHTLSANTHTKTMLEEIALSGKQLMINYASGSLTEKEALSLEGRLIKKYGRKTKDIGGILTNVRLSGTVNRSTKSINRKAYTSVQLSKDAHTHISAMCRKHRIKASFLAETLMLAVVSCSMAGSGSVTFPGGARILLL